jgi:ribosome maturation factor RimP
MIPRNKIQEVAEKIIGNGGFELVDMDYFNGGKHSYVRLMVDRPQGGITIDEVAAISRELAVHLDVEMSLSQYYRLEVSSPGIGRALKSPRDFNRNIGRPLHVRYRSPDGREKEVRGMLKARLDDCFALQENGSENTYFDRDVIEVKTDVKI